MLDGNLKTWNGTEWVQTDAGTAIPDSGVARYEFEQDVLDSWNDNDGTNNGASFSTDSAVGSYALSTDGLDDNVTVSSIQFSEGDDFSATGWFKYDGNGDDAAQGLVTQRDGFSTNDWSVNIDQNNNNIAFNIGESNNTAVIASADGSLSPGSYYFFAATKGGDTYTLYRDDAQQIGSETNAGGWTASETLRLAQLQSGSGTLSGVLDDVRLYNKALTSTEVSNLYNTGSI